MRRLVLVGSLILVSLTGCETEMPAVAPSISAPAPSPTATQARETGDERPAQAFDGDCSALFGDAELSEALGATVIASATFRRTNAADIVVEQVGGVLCGWFEADYLVGVNAAVMPVGAVEAVPEGVTCTQNTDPEIASYFTCTIAAVRNGLDLRLRFWLPDGDRAVADARAASVLSLFDAHATPDRSAPLPIPAAGAWLNPVDCDALGASVDVAALLDTPGLEQYRGGGDVFPLDAITELWGDTYGLDCSWGVAGGITDEQYAAGQTRDFSVQVLGGAAWLAAEVAMLPEAQEIAVAGFDRAILVTPSDGYAFAQLHLFRGPNWLSTSVDPDRLGSLAPVLGAVAIVLDTTGSP